MQGLKIPTSGGVKNILRFKDPGKTSIVCREDQLSEHSPNPRVESKESRISAKTEPLPTTTNVESEMDLSCQISSDN